MFINLICASVPYLAVVMGLFIFHNAWVAILTYHAGIAAIIFLSKPVVPFKQIIRNTNNNLLILSLAIGASAGVLVYLLWPLLSIRPDINIYLQSIGFTATAWPYLIAYFFMINSVFEEYYWRGHLGNNSKRPVLNDFLFAGYHLLVLAGNAGALWLVVAFFALSGAAWYWRQISRLTGGLLTATLSHMAADLTVILSVYYLTAMV